MKFIYFNRKSHDNSKVTQIDRLAVYGPHFTIFSDLDIDSIHITKLDVSASNLTLLLDVQNYATYVTELNLDQNPIKAISRTFLAKFANLKWLKVTSDQLNMKPYMFEALKNLKVLYLTQNELNVDWFHELSMLEELHVDLMEERTFDYVGLVGVLPALKVLKVNGYGRIECGFLRKMAEDLKAINRFEVMKDSFVPARTFERKLYLYGSTCDYF